MCFIASGYLLKFLSLPFISLNILGKVIKGSKQEDERIQFMNPSQNSMWRESVLFCFPRLLGKWETKGPRKMAPFYATPFWSQCSKQTTWSSLILVFSLLFSTLIGSCDSEEQIDSDTCNFLPAWWCSLWCLFPCLQTVLCLLLLSPLQPHPPREDTPANSKLLGP